MTFVEFAGVVLGAAGLFASILGAFLSYASRQNGQATRQLIRELQAETQAFLERMDKRADQRHGEALEAIITLKATR